MTQLSRRGFLKIAGATLAGAFASRKLPSLRLQDTTRPNIIIILMDALSARHLSLHGYPRSTTPNIDAFAERSAVFHNHYSAGNFTTPGTASMLTGMLPWKHRAMTTVNPEFVSTNPYTLLGSDYFRFAFSQNPWVNRLIWQYDQDVDRLLPPYQYSLLEENEIDIMNWFKNDHTIAEAALQNFLFSTRGEGAPTGSLALGYINKSRNLNYTDSRKFPSYQKGVPEVMNGDYLIPYLNEEVYDGVYLETLRLENQQSPYFAYFHLYTPHHPYRPHKKYKNLFHNDRYQPAPKPAHRFSIGLSEDYELSQRVLYDRQIAQADYEFGKLIKRLEESNILDNSYLIFTSDHGEMFERGFMGHGGRLMYDPVLRIPLLIHTPGQIKREDVFALTSNIDILPTLLSVAGKDPAPDVDGRILPGFGGQTDNERPIFSMFAIDDLASSPITKSVIAMHKHSYKLIAYLGYDVPDQVFELYDLENDPEELENLTTKAPKILSTLKDELLAHLDNANRAFFN